MKILQQLPARCACAVCDTACQCGDCTACSNTSLDGAVLRNAKRISIAACLIMVFGGFVFFAPVVALGATPKVTETISLRVQPASNSTLPLGSIGYCYFGVGAVLIRGTYYPSVSQNQTSVQICK